MCNREEYKIDSMDSNRGISSNGSVNSSSNIVPVINDLILISMDGQLHQYINQIFMNNSQNINRNDISHSTSSSLGTTSQVLQQQVNNKTVAILGTIL